MTEATAKTGTADELAETFEALDRAEAGEGPKAAVEWLVKRLDERGEYRALLDALLLKARIELGLPPVQVGSLNDVPEPTRGQYEDRYVAAIREVGGKILASGDVPGAWPYFRAIGEPEPVALAIDAYAPAEDDDRLNATIEVAFNQGANPKRGYELILANYGTCSAVTAFEHLPREGNVRSSCAAALVRQLHQHLTANLRAEIAHRGQPLPAEGASIAALVEGRDWLFGDEAYHIDVSHLASTVRFAPLVTDPDALALAFDLTEYGRRLSVRHVYEGDPPFENVYEDHGAYLRALLGREADAAVAHFQAKLSPKPPFEGEGEGSGSDDGPETTDSAPAQVLVGLLERLGKLDEAIEVAAGHLRGVPESTLFCPSLAQLCQRAGRADRLAEVAREVGDPVRYVAALSMKKGGEASPR